MLTYIRSRSITLRDLIPGVTHFAAFEPQPNEYARQRLFKQAKVFSSSPKPEQVKGKVILTWKVPGVTGLVRNLTGNRVAYEDGQGASGGMGGPSGNHRGKRQGAIGLAVDLKDTKLPRQSRSSGWQKWIFSDESGGTGVQEQGPSRQLSTVSLQWFRRLANPIFKAFIIATEQIYAFELEEYNSDFTSGLGEDE